MSVGCGFVLEMANKIYKQGEFWRLFLEIYIYMLYSTAVPEGSVPICDGAWNHN